MLIALSILSLPVVAVAAFVGGAVFSYLFLRANPAKKAALDAEVAKEAKKL